MYLTQLCQVREWGGVSLRATLICSIILVTPTGRRQSTYAEYAILKPNTENHDFRQNPKIRLEYRLAGESDAANFEASIIPFVHGRLPANQNKSLFGRIKDRAVYSVPRRYELRYSTYSRQQNVKSGRQSRVVRCLIVGTSIFES